MGKSGKQIDVAYVAALARLEISAEAQERLQRDMESIVGYIEELAELDVTGIEPLAHASMLTNVVREDVTKKPFDRALMLKNAPGIINDNLIKVPQVLPGEGMN